MNKATTARLRKFAKKLKLIRRLGGACSKCGEVDVHALCFHHIDENNKKFKVSSQDFSFSRLLQEANKCMLLCHNCHAGVHSLRVKPQKIMLLEYMKTSHCSSCGYCENKNALQFHHKDPESKEFQITSAYFNAKSDIPSEIKNELEKCEVLCCNCHNKRHVDVDFFLSNSDKIEELILLLDESSEPVQYNYSNILSRYMLTNDVTETANQLNISRNVVLRVLRKNNIGNFDDIINEDTLTKLHAEGLNSNEISKILNRPQSSICRKLNKMGLSPNKRTCHTIRIKLNKSEILELLETKTYDEIGAICGTTKQAIYKKVMTKDNKKRGGVTLLPLL